ncbi:MAG TPA: hypothetical protein VGA36_09550 [Nitriliruptorales bacterium]
MYALFAVVILTGLVTVFVARALNETRFSANNRDFETVIHVAEAGSDRAISVANQQTEATQEPSYYPGTVDDPIVYLDMDGDGAADPVSDEEWVLALADLAAASGELIETSRGQAYGVRPCDDLDPAGDGVCDPEEVLDVVFGVGFTPSYDAAERKVRIIKLLITRDFFIPDYAILTEANMKLGGNASINAPDCDTSASEEEQLENCVADVHVNGSVDTTGSAHEIQGSLSATGTVDGGANAVNGTSEGADPEDIPEVFARDFYNRPTSTTGSFTSDPGGKSVTWHDLCPDGTIRPHSGTGTPCAAPDSEIEWSVGDDTTSAFGWSFKDSGGNPVWSSNAVEAGVFYVYKADADINGSASSTQRAASVFVEQDPLSPGNTGSLSLGGNPDMVAAFPDVIFVADGDIKMKGTGGGGSTVDCEATPEDCQKYAGFISVGEQLDVSGNVALEGSMTVQDRADLHKLVQRQGTISTFISGSMILDFDPNQQIDLTGIVTVEYWNEL